jgi:hypothetical protein
VKAVVSTFSAKKTTKCDVRFYRQRPDKSYLDCKRRSIYSCEPNCTRLDLNTNFKQSKLIVLRSLSLFLRQVTSNSTLTSTRILPSATPTWYMASSFATPEAYQTFESALRASSLSTSTSQPWISEADQECESFVGHFPFVRHSDELSFNLHELSDLSHATVGGSDSRTMQNTYDNTDRPEVIYISVSAFLSLVLLSTERFLAFVSHASSNTCLDVSRLRTNSICTWIKPTGN